MDPDRTRHDPGLKPRLRAVGDGTHLEDISAHRERLILIAQAEADRIVAAARLEAGDIRSEARRLLLEARSAATRLVALAEEHASWRARLERVGPGPDIVIDLDRYAETTPRLRQTDPVPSGRSPGDQVGGDTGDGRGTTVYQRRGSGLRRRIEAAQGRSTQER